MSLSKERNFKDTLKIINSFTQSYKLINLNELCDEHIFSKVLLDIEPLIQQDNGKIVLYKEKIFIVRYGNFQSLINCISNYFDKIKGNIHKTAFIKCLFQIKNIIYEDIDQIEQLGEILLTISAICSKKDKYLDKLTELGEEYLTFYLSKIEKYIVIENDNYSSNNSRINKLSITHIESIRENKYNEQHLYTEGLETEIIKLNKICHKLKTNNEELQLKYKDALKELENKNSINDDPDIKNQYFEESLSSFDLKNRLAKKEDEIDQIKKENEQIFKKYIEENDLLKEINKNLEKKIENLEFHFKEIEILKEKAKEYEDLKEKQRNYQCLILELEVKDNQIKKYFNDKKQYEFNIDKLYQELLGEREKFRHLEFEKKTQEYEILKLNGILSNLENHQKKNVTKFILQKEQSEENSEQLISLNLLADENMDNNNIDKLELLRICQEQSEKINKYIVENDEILRNYEKNKELLYKISKDRDELLDENKTLLNDCNDLREEIKLKGENIKLLEEKMMSEGDKYRHTINEKLLLSKEIETLKKQLAYYLSFINNIEKEKKDIVETNNVLQLEIEKYRLYNTNLNNNLLAKTKDKIQSSIPDLAEKKEKSLNNQEYLKEISKLRNEIITIKKEHYDIQIKSNDEIQTLKNRILELTISLNSKETEYNTMIETLNNVKEEYSSLYNTYQVLSENYNLDLCRIKEDINIYRNSLETLRTAVDFEHKMISNSLEEINALFYDLKENLTHSGEY